MTLSAPQSRSISSVSQLSMIIGAQFRRLLVSRKTKALAVVQLVPIVGALIFVAFKDVDGLTMFSNIIENLTIPVLLPLVALFYGGPAVVDEMEGRTLTYLTLRPIGKATMFAGKVIASILIALPMMLLPILLLFLVSLLQSDDMASTATFLGQIVGAVTMGVVVYSTTFATLGAIFASGLLASVMYFIAIEVVLRSLPVVELFSSGYHVRNIAGLQVGKEGFLDQLFSFISTTPIDVKWWMSVLFCAVVTALTGAIGGYIFKEKQYYV